MKNKNINKFVNTSCLRKSSFCFGYKKGNTNWLFNTLSRKIYQLNYSWNEISQEEINQLPSNQNADINDFLTSATNYEQELKDYYELKKEKNKYKLTIYYTITEHCDMKCTYCFENHLTRISTNKFNISKFIILLKKELSKNHNIKYLDLILFGGEPLLRVDYCLLLLNSLNKICKKYNLKTKILMTTNGIIVNKKHLYELKKIGLTDLQITFDGWKKSHNEIREIENNGGYNKLLSNLIWLGEHFNLIIKYNIRKTNVIEFRYFINDIKNLKLKRYKIKLEALQSTLTNNDSFYFNSNDTKLALVYFKLAKFAIISSVPVDISSALKPPCMATADNSFMIEPDGDISACVSAYKMKSLFLGNTKKLMNLNLSRDFLRNNIMKAANSKCIVKRCSYFPICETGCFFTKEISNISYDKINCRERYFSTLIPKLIELKILD